MAAELFCVGPYVNLMIDSTPASNSFSCWRHKGEHELLGLDALKAESSLVSKWQLLLATDIRAPTAKRPELGRFQPLARQSAEGRAAVSVTQRRPVCKPPQS